MTTKYRAGNPGPEISRRHWLGAAAAAVGSMSIGGLAGCGGGGGAASGASAGIASTPPDPAPAVGGAPAPAPAPAPAAAPTGFFNPSLAESNWVNVSTALHTKWGRAGGDWVDANGLLHGPVAKISVTLAATTEVDISAIDGDLFVHPEQAQWGEPMIDGEPAVAFWTDPTSNRALLPVGDDPTKTIFPFRAPVIVLNPKRGKKLTFRTIYIGATMRIDKVRGPAIVDLPMLPNPPGLLPPDMRTLDTLTQAALYAEMGMGAGVGNADGTGIWGYEQSNHVDAENGNMPYLRCAITPAGQKGIGWFWWHNPVGEIYERFCLWFEDDIALGMTELGVKLPGPEGHDASWRMLQGRPDHANPGLYAILDYRYSADSGNGFGVTTPGYGGTIVKTGRWYVFEQHARSNTHNADGTPNDDGVAEFWLNNHPITRSEAIRWFAAASGRFEKFFINLYHGGMGLPSRSIHYRLAKLARSTTRIGIPRELLGT